MSLHTDSVSKMSGGGGLRPVVIGGNGTTDGASVDTKDFGSLTWIVESGVITDGDHQILLEESDTDFTGETVVADADIIDAVIADYDFAASDGGTIVRIGIIAKKQFQRLSMVSTGVTGGGVFSWVAVEGHFKSEPPAAQKIAI